MGTAKMSFVCRTGTGGGTGLYTEMWSRLVDVNAARGVGPPVDTHEDVDAGAGVGDYYAAEGNVSACSDASSVLEDAISVDTPPVISTTFIPGAPSPIPILSLLTGTFSIGSANEA